MKLTLDLSLRRALYTCYAAAALALATTTTNLAHAETYEFIGDGSDGGSIKGSWLERYHWSPRWSLMYSYLPDGSSVHFAQAGYVENVNSTQVITLSTDYGADDLFTLHCTGSTALSYIGTIDHKRGDLQIFYDEEGSRNIGTIHNGGSLSLLHDADVTVLSGVYSPHSSSDSDAGSIDIRGHTLSLIGTQQDQTIGQLHAAKLYVDNGKVSLHSTRYTNIKLETTNDGAIALLGTQTFSDEVINNGTLTATGLTLSGKVSGSGRINVDNQLSLTSSDQNQSMGIISAASISIANGSISVGSIVNNYTDINFTGTSGTLKLGQNEAVGSVNGVGTVSSNGYDLTLADAIWISSSSSVNINLGSGVLRVGGTSGRIVNLTASRFKIISGSATILYSWTDTMDLDITNGARVTFQNHEWIGDLWNTGTVASDNKNLTITGSVDNADVDLGSGTLSLHNNLARSIDSLTVGRLTLNANTLTINDITSDATHLTALSGATIILKNAETVGSIYNTGTVATENKNLTVNGEITGANINLGTGLLTVNNVVNDRVINNLTAGGLTLNAGALAVNSITSDTTNLTIASGAVLTLKDTETIKNLAGVGTVITEDLDLIVTGTVAGTSIDLGTGRLTVSQTGNMGSLTAGMLDINAGTFTVNNLTTATTDVDVAEGAKLILNNAVTIKNLVGTGTIQTQGENLTVAGTINGADINLNTGYLTVSQTGNLGTLTAGLLTLNAGTLTVENLASDGISLRAEAGAKIFLNNEETVNSLTGTGIVETENKNLTVKTSISYTNVDLGTGTLTVSQTGTGNMGSLAAGALTLNEGTLTVNSITSTTTDINIAGGATLILPNTATINNLSGTGTLQREDKNLTVTGTITGTNIDLGTGTLTVSQTGNMGALTASLLDLNAGAFNVDSIRSATTDIDIAWSTKLTLNNAATIKNLVGVGTVEARNKNLTITGTVAGASINLGYGTLAVQQSGNINLLTAGGFTLTDGTFTVNDLTTDTTSLDIAAEAKVILNREETISGLSGTGTVETDNKKLSVFGSITGTNVDLGTGTLTVSQTGTGNMGSLTAGRLDLNAGTLTVDSISSATTDIDIAEGATLILPNTATINNLSGTGTLQREDKNLTVTGIIAGTNIDLGTGTLTVSQTGNMGALTASLLDLNAGTLTVNSITSASTDIDIAGGATLILNNAATINNLVDTGAVETTNKNLTITGTVAGADIDLGTGILTVHQTGNVDLLTAGGLTLSAGTFTVNDLTTNATSLNIEAEAIVILNKAERLSGLAGTGTVQTDDHDLSVIGPMSGTNVDLGTGTLTVSLTDTGNMGSLTAGALTLNAGELTVDSITTSTTGLSINYGATLILNNTETINNLAGIGTLKREDKNLTVAGTITDTNIDLGTGTLTVSQTGNMGSLTAGLLVLNAGELTIANLTSNVMDLDIANGAKVILDKNFYASSLDQVNDILSAGTIIAKDKTLYVTGAINGADIDLGTGELHVFNNIADREIDSFTAGVCSLINGTLTVHELTCDTTDITVYYFATLTFNQSETINNLDGYGTLATLNKDLTVTGQIRNIDINLGTGTLTVNNVVADRLIDSLTAGGLTLNAGELTVNDLTTKTTNLTIAAGAKVILSTYEEINDLLGTGTLRTLDGNFLVVTGRIEGADIDVGTGTLYVDNDIANREIGALTAGLLSLDAGTLTVDSLNVDAIDLSISEGATLTLNQEETIREIEGAGTIKMENKNLTLTGRIVAQYGGLGEDELVDPFIDIELGTGTLTVNNDIANREISSLTAGGLTLNAGQLTVNDLTTETTNLTIAGGATVILSNYEEIKNLVGTGTLRTLDRNPLVVTGRIEGADIDVSTGTLYVRNDVANREIGALTAGHLSLDAGTLTVNSLKVDAIDLDIFDGATLTLNQEETIKSINGAGTIKMENKNLTLTGRIVALEVGPGEDELVDPFIDIELGTGTLTVNNDIANREISSLTAGGLTLNAGELTVNDLTTKTTNLTIADGATLTLNNYEEINNLAGTGTLKTDNKAAVITGTIDGADIDVGSANLYLENGIANSYIDSATVIDGTLELDARTLTINHITSDTTSLRIEEGAKIILKNEETISSLNGTGMLETENKNLTVTGSMIGVSGGPSNPDAVDPGVNIDLGTGTLTVNNEGATHSQIKSLKAGGLNLAENVSVNLAGQGSIGHLKGATAAELTVYGSDASYTLSSAKDVTIEVVKGELLIGDPASAGYTLDNKGIIGNSNSELTNVTLNIRDGGKVQSVANYLGTGNTIYNEGGTLILKGGTLRSDITMGFGVLSQIIIDGTVISNNAINCSLIEFTITDASVYDQLTLQGMGSALRTEGVLIDISDYTLRNGDSFTLVSGDGNLGGMMNDVQLNFTGKDLLAEGISYDIFNTGSQWGVRFNLIPEPSTATLSLLALAGLLTRRRRQTA